LANRFEVLKHSGYLLLAKLFVRLASVPFLIYVAATLGPSMFGVFAFVLASVEMVSSLGDFGLSRYGTRVMVREEKNHARFAGIILVMQLATSLLLAGLGAAFILLIAPESPKLQVLLLGLVAVILSAFTYTTETIFTATSRFPASALLTVIGRAIYIAAGFVVLSLGHSVVAVMWAFVGSIAIESLLRMVYAATKITGFSFSFTWGEVKHVARGTLPFAVTGIASLVYFRADTIILGIVRGDLDVGIYGAAYSFFSFFMWLPIVINRTLLPRLISRYRNDPKEGEIASLYWYREMGVAGVAIAFTMTVLARPIIGTLMPDTFSDSIIVLQILMWSIPPLMMVSTGFNSLTVCDREKTGANTSVIYAALIVALDFALIPHFGPRGAAVAMVVTTLLWEFTIHWLLTKHVLAPGHGLLRVFGMPVLGGACMAIVALAVSGYGAFVSLTAGLAVYGAIVMMLRFVERR
jgi:O-antigen/teichoic acid export membrane protein